MCSHIGGSSGWIQRGKKHEIYVPDFGHDLFCDFFYSIIGGTCPLHSLDPQLSQGNRQRFFSCVGLSKAYLTFLYNNCVNKPSQMCLPLYFWILPKAGRSSTDPEKVSS